MQVHTSGTHIAGRYEVAGRPLVGGMGVVYLCFDHQEQRPVALKTFKPEYLPDRAARERFLEEGNTWVRLGKHPHIVRCHGVERIGDGREVYLVLELVAKEEGRRDASLRSWLTPGKPLPVDQALLIALQIVRGMRHATETIPGFVHRDLKPENVLVGADRLSNAPINRVRVADYGLVKGLRAEQVVTGDEADLTQRSARLTRIGSMVGTPAYMAPEQWEGGEVGVQADIYAMGCILGELLTGHMLVQGATLDALRRAHQDGQALRVVQSAPDSVHDILPGCLGVEPSLRYRDWATLEVALAGAYGQVVNRSAPEAEAAGAQSRAERIAAGWSHSEMGVAYMDMGNAKSALGHFGRAQQVGQSEGERRLEGSGLTHLGIASAALGNSRRAIEFYEKALVIDREIGDPHGEATDLNGLGAAYFAIGDVQRAIEYHEHALAINRVMTAESTVGSPAWIVWRRSEGGSLGNLGTCYAKLGETRRAVGLHESAMAIHRETGSRQGEAIDLHNLGSAYLSLGDTQQAIGYFESVLTISREIGDRSSEGSALSSLATAYRTLGDARRATRYYLQALRIAQELGDRNGEVVCMCGLGDSYQQLGETHRAVGYYEQALATSREISDRRGEVSALGDLGSAYQLLGEVQRAIELYRQALAIAHDIDSCDGQEVNLARLGSVYLQLGDARNSSAYFEQALAITREIGDRRGEGVHLGNLGNVYLLLRDVQRAIESFEQALAISRETKNRSAEAASLGCLGSAYANIGDARRAVRYYQRAVAIDREIGDRVGEGTDMSNLGTAYKQLGEIRRAIEYYDQALAISREVGDASGMASRSLNMAVLYSEQGNATVAIPLAKEAARLFAQLGHTANAQQANHLVAKLESGGRLDSEPTSTEILDHFTPVIDAVVAVARGNGGIRRQLESYLPDAVNAGWMIQDPIYRIWAGERNETKLTNGIDSNSALIVREILRRL